MIKLLFEKDSVLLHAGQLNFVEGKNINRGSEEDKITVIDPLVLAVMNNNQVFLKEMIDKRSNYQFTVYPTSRLIEVLKRQILSNPIAYLEMVTKYFIPLIGNNQQKEKFLLDFEAKIERIRKK